MLARVEQRSDGQAGGEDARELIGKAVVTGPAAAGSKCECSVTWAGRPMRR